MGTTRHGSTRATFHPSLFVCTFCHVLHDLLQACWAAGVDLNAEVSGAEEKRAQLRARGVPEWKTASVSVVQVAYLA